MRYCDNTYYSIVSSVVFLRYCHFPNIQLSTVVLLFNFKSSYIF